MHYERGLNIHSSSHALHTRTPHTLVKSCITNEDSTYTRQVIHYERGLHIKLVKSCITNKGSTYTRPSHALRTRTPHTLVKSCIMNEDSTYTRQVMDYERGLHVHSSSHALRTRTPHTLVKSYITNKVYMWSPRS